MHWGKRIGLGMAAVTVIGGTLIGGTTLQLSAAMAGDRDPAAQSREADKQAKLAEKALAKHKLDEAVGRAEQAVLLDADHAGHRALLGRTYLGAGRFASAAQAFADALTLNPTDGRSALNLSLARTALGDWAGARGVLEANAAIIQPVDRGLAVALAGDPMAAITILGEAARERSANAKVRQNLALSLALAGKWQEANTIAQIDLSAADAAKRILEWARFAHPAKASDQVASLLGVTAVEDGGMPVQLALRPQGQALALAAAPAAAMPVVQAEPVASPVEVVPMPSIAAEADGPRVGNIVFAARREVVQAVPVAPQTAAPVRRVRAAAAAPTPRAGERPLAGGTYFVQLGAFDSAGVARDAWTRISRRVPAIAGQTPRGMSTTVNGDSFYRLSVGGFARGDALSVCRSVRAKGGRCFVRAGAGEQVASWARGPQVAAR